MGNSSGFPGGVEPRTASSIRFKSNNSGKLDISTDGIPVAIVFDRMAQDSTFKTGVFSGDVTRWTTGWLTQEQGYSTEQIDGAEPMALGPMTRCADRLVSRNGQIEANEAFAVIGLSRNFGKFVAHLQASRTNPFLKFDPSFDLSWLKLEGSAFGGFDVEAGKKTEWMVHLAGGPADREGTFANLLEDMTRHNATPNIPYLSQAPVFIDRALRTTEFGLLPLKEQLDLIDRFLDSLPWNPAYNEKEEIREAVRRAAVEHSQGVTPNRLISLYVQLRARALEREGQAGQAAELYQMAVSVDPQNLTAAANLGVMQLQDPKSKDPGFASLQAAYEAGLRDRSLQALAEEYAARGDYPSAIQVALDLRPRELTQHASAEEIAWDMKIFGWARQENDLLLIADLLERRSTGYRIKDTELQDILISLYEDPQAWVDAAEGYWKNGDYEKADLAFTKAYKVIHEVVIRTASGGIQRVRRPNPDSDLRTRILTLQNDLANDRDDLPRTLWNRYEALQVLSETQPIGADFAEIDGELRLQEAAIGYLQELEVLESDAAPPDVHALLQEAKAQAKEGQFSAQVTADALAGLEGKLLAQPAVPSMKVNALIADARLEILHGGLDLNGTLEVLGRLEEALTQATSQRIRHLDVHEFIASARTQIAAGALNGNEKMVGEGVLTLRELQRYAALERKKEAIFQKALSYYPPNTRLAFEWDLSAETLKRKTAEPWKYPAFSEPVDYEATHKSVSELDIVKTVERLEKEYPELAKVGKALLDDLAMTATHKKGYLHKANFGTLGSEAYNPLYNPVTDGPIVDGYREPTVGSLSSLACLNDKLGGKFGDDELVTKFFMEVDKTRIEAALKDNEDYKKRMELDHALRALPDYMAYLKVFEVAEMRKFEGVDPSHFGSARDFLLERAKSLKTYLEGQQDKVGDGLPSDQAVERESANLAETERVTEEIAWLESLSIPGDNDWDKKQKMADLLPALREVAIRLVAHEESHVRGLLEEEIAAVGGAGMDEVRIELQGISTLDIYGTDLTDPEARRVALRQLTDEIGGYRALAGKIDDIAFSRAIDGRIASIKSDRGTSQTAGNTAHALFSLGGLLDPLIGDGNYDPHGEMLEKWEKVKSLWDSGDPGKKQEARSLFIALAAAEVNGDLADMTKLAGRFNLSAAVVAVVLAAVTAGAASELVAPLAEAVLPSWLAGEAVVMTNAIVFTGSIQVYNGLLTGGLSGAWRGLEHIAENPLSFGEEVVLTYGMFKFLGLFQKMLGPILAKPLGHTVGDFVAEGVGFQIWDFLQTNYTLIKNGVWDPIKVAKHSFDVTSLDSGFGHGFLFLIGLKVGGAIASPLARPMNEGARNLAYKALGIDAMERELQRDLASNVRALDDYFRKGKGDLEKLLDEQERILLKQKGFLEKIDPEIRNEDLLSVNGRMLDAVHQFRDAYRSSVLEKVRQGGSNNPYGVKVAAGGLLRYSGKKGAEFVGALKSDPSVKWVHVADNGLIVAQIVDPLGRPARVRFAPIGITTARIEAMRDVLGRPSVSSRKQSEVAPPQVPVLQPVNI